MSDVIDRVAAHYRGLEHKVIEVPEWGESPDAPLLIYGKPMNVDEAQRIYKAGAESSFGMFVEALILLARDAQGKPIFTIEHKPKLRRAAAREVVERVGTELVKARGSDELLVDFEDVVKN